MGRGARPRVSRPSGGLHAPTIRGGQQGQAGRSAETGRSSRRLTPEVSQVSQYLSDMRADKVHLNPLAETLHTKP